MRAPTNTPGPEGSQNSRLGESAGRNGAGGGVDYIPPSPAAMAELDRGLQSAKSAPTVRHDIVLDEQETRDLVELMRKSAEANPRLVDAIRAARVDRSQSDAEIGAIVRAALNRYLAASVVTHAGVTQRLELECVESTEVSAVLGPGKVVVRIECSSEWVQP